MREYVANTPKFIEQVRAKIQGALITRSGVTKYWAEKVIPTERFRQRVTKFGRGEIPRLEIWELCALWCAMTEANPPRFKPLPNNYSKEVGRLERKKPPSKATVVHPALADLDKL